MKLGLKPLRRVVRWSAGIAVCLALTGAESPEEKSKVFYLDRSGASTDLNDFKPALPNTPMELVNRAGESIYLRPAGSKSGPSYLYSAMARMSDKPLPLSNLATKEVPNCAPNLNLDLTRTPTLAGAVTSAPNSPEETTPQSWVGGRQPASAPASESGDQVISTLNSANGISDTARGMEIVQAATAARQALGQAAADDSRALAQPYQNLSTDQLGDALKRAQTTLSDAASTLDGATQSSLDLAERSRFRNLYLNAADKTSLGIDAIEQSRQRGQTLGAESPFTGLLDQGAKETNPLAKLPALAQIFGNRLPSFESATSNDALVNRLVMFNGLPPAERSQMQANLKLLQNATVTRADGKSIKLPIVHNGYVFGAKAHGTTDCSAFVSAALPSDVRKARFTTLDFKQMWTYQHSGRFPNPPRYAPERAELVKSSALSFAALDLEAGDALSVGDLLVYRADGYPAGHIFIVRSYNPLNMIAEVIEASQSAGTVRVREFPITVDPASAKVRYIRPGLVGLRLKPTTNRGCSYAKGGAK